MKRKLNFFLFGALILIITNSLLAYFQSFIFGERSDLELYLIFFLFSLILFQWAFILVLIGYYVIRKKISSNNQIINWLLGFLICFLPYSLFVLLQGG